MKVEGNRVDVEGAGLALALDGAKLEGTYSHLKVPVALKRTDSFPVEVPIPELPKGPDPKWTAVLGATIWAPAALRDGFAVRRHGRRRVPRGVPRGRQDCVTFPAGKPIHGEALVTDDAVFFVCDIGFLFKLDRKTGAEVWRYALDDAGVPRILPHPFVDGFDHTSPRPTLADGVLYVGSGDGGLHAVDATTGKRVWRFAASGKIRTDAFVAGPTVYATEPRPLRVRRRPSDGQGGVEEGPALRDHELARRRRGQAARRDARERALRARPRAGRDPLARALLGLVGRVDAGPLEGPRLHRILRRAPAVSCYDPRYGRGRVAHGNVFGRSWGRPVVTENHVYAAVGGVAPYPIRHVGGLCKIERESGRMLLAATCGPACGTVRETGFAAGPALLKDVLVVGDLDGNLLAFPAD